MLTGNDEYWMLAAPSIACPSIIVNYLGGNSRPTMRTYLLKDGEWGIGVDLFFDCGVTPVDGRPLYFGTGG
jgi:hypothetical protein